MASKGRKMVPYSDAAMGAMFAHMAEIMVEYGLVEPQEDAKAFAVDVMHLLQSQGHLNAYGDVILGRFIVLPSQSPAVYYTPSWHTEFPSPRVNTRVYFVQAQY